MVQTIAMFKQSNNLKWTLNMHMIFFGHFVFMMWYVRIVYVWISSQIWSDTFFYKKVNPKTKYGYVMTVFAPFLNPNFHLPLFYRLLLPWTAWIASGFKYLLGWAEQQEACEVFSPLLWVNSKFTVYKIICQRKLYSNQNVQYHW